jgi:hypothetical protein
VVGIAQATAVLSSTFGISTSDAWFFYRDGNKYNGGAAAYGATYTVGDVITVEYDAGTGTLTFFKNGASQGAAFTGISATDLHPCTAQYGGAGGGATYNVNFGQRPFTYALSTGYLALSTANLTTPVIDKPSLYFDVETFTGTGATRTKTGLLFQPDLSWFKGRSGATDHAIYDSVRGVQKDLASNTVAVETTEAQGLTAFNTDGYSTGTLAKLNANAATYTAWLMKKGAIPGFDIVGYTGNGANRTIAHAIGAAPAFMIVRCRNVNTGDGHVVWHKNLPTPATKYLILATTAAAANDAGVLWNSAIPTSSVFSLGANASVNGNTNTYIAYLFAEIAGFSKFGSFTGNASADGPFVYCGFKPKLVLIKRSDSTGDWFIWDRTRDPVNPAVAELLGNSAAAEVGAADLDFTSNGFKIRATAAGYNGSAGTFVFAAFAEAPFKYALAV